jgi:hypothetical protein
VEGRDEGSVWLGFGMATGINVAAGIVGGLTLFFGVGGFVLMGLGLVQAAWILPMAASFRKSGQRKTMKGVIAAAVFTLLLTAGCWVLVAALGISRMH